MKPYRFLSFAVGLFLFGVLLFPAWSAQAQQALCFPENPMIKHCIVSFRAYWEQNGGLQIFGYPISSEQPERSAETGRTHVVQWFERNRFEAHPENRPPYDVLLGRLGADRLAQMGRNWQSEGREPGPKPGCLWFAETGHNVCDFDAGAPTPGGRGFKSYWEAEGLADPRLSLYARSLALHGLPLTEARMETNSSGHRVMTQWFERGRFEWHPGNPADARVLLGLLGNEIKGSPAAQTIKYLWPMTAPVDLSVERDGSWATDRDWMLQLSQPHATQPDVTITGGIPGEAPGRKVQDTTVRGQRAEVFATDTGYAVLWAEDGQPYVVIGRRSMQEIVQIARGLEEIDRTTWEQRVRGDEAP